MVSYGAAGERQRDRDVGETPYAADFKNKTNIGITRQLRRRRDHLVGVCDADLRLWRVARQPWPARGADQFLLHRTRCVERPDSGRRSSRRRRVATIPRSVSEPAGEYSLDDRTDIRAAVTRGIARPNYYRSCTASLWHRVRSCNNSFGNLSAGNPDLKPQHAWNLRSSCRAVSDTRRADLGRGVLQTDHGLHLRSRLHLRRTRRRLSRAISVRSRKTAATPRSKAPK